MSLIGGAFGIALLNLASRNGAVERCDIATAYIGRSKLEVLLGPRIWDVTRDKDVLDFGCGPGSEAVEIAEHGARHVVGIDLRQRWLDLGDQQAEARGVADRCTFAREWSDPVDLIVSLDSFEHFADPAAVLTHMRGLLRPSRRARSSTTSAASETCVTASSGASACPRSGSRRIQSACSGRSRLPHGSTSGSTSPSFAPSIAITASSPEAHRHV